jgi:hypothetical protein
MTPNPFPCNCRRKSKWTGEKRHEEITNGQARRWFFAISGTSKRPNRLKKTRIEKENSKRKLLRLILRRKLTFFVFFFAPQTSLHGKYAAGKVSARRQEQL